MLIRVLGPTGIDGAGELAGRDRRVLSALVVMGGRVCPADRLAAALYGDEPPRTWRKVVQGAIGRLRRVLGPMAVETTAAGYRLAIGDEEIDARRFERLLGRGSELAATGEAERAVTVLREALDLFRGEPLTDLDGWEPARAEGARLLELRLLAEEKLVDALLEAGEHRDAIAVAGALADQQPLREQRWSALALAQYRTGRQGDALRSITRARRVLADELGLEPGSNLLELERAILAQDPELTSGSAVAFAASVVCPYKGLAGYDIGDSDRFFGRERAVQDCLARLATAGFVAVLGPSGCGKSSLARAGIAPALRRPGRDAVVISPGAAPARALAGVPPDDALVIDQMEEMFTICDDDEERHRFVEAIEARVVRAPIVVTLRADRLASVADLPTLATRVEAGIYLLRPMEERDLRKAIEEPALRAGLRVEPGLVDLLVHDVIGQPGALPMLSHALTEIWARREGRVLTVAAYRAVGGVWGAIGKTAEQAIEGLPPEGLRIARELFLRLVTLTDGEPVRRRIPREDVRGDAQHAGVLDALARARLLTVDAVSVQVAHEALAVAWPRLQGWLDEDRDGQRILQHLTASSAGWAALGRDEAELYRGARLRAAEEWVAAASPELTATERAFLDASLELADRERADQASQVASQARTNRRLRRLLTGVALALVVALLAGTFALVQRSRASRAADRAEGQAEVADATRLAAQAMSLAGTRLDLALNLAVEAHRLHPTLETEGALETVLAATPPGLERLVHFDPPATFAGISNDGRLLAAPGDDGTVRLIDAGSGHEVRRLVGHHTGALFASFSGDDRSVAAGDDDGLVMVWDVASGRRLGPSLDAGGGPAYGIFDPSDGRRLFTAGHDGVVTAWDLTDPGRPRSVELFRFPLPGGLPRAASPSEQNPPPGPGAPPADLPLVLLPSDDGERLLVGSVLREGSSYLWDLRRGNLLAVVDGAPGAWSPDGATVAMARGAEVVIVDAATGVQQGEVLAGFNSSVPVMAFSPDGRRLAAGDRDGTVHVFDLTTGRETRRLAIHDDLALTQFLADGRLFSRSSRLGAIVRLDAPAVAPMARLLGGHAGNVNVNFTADGTGVVTGDDNGRARTWDAETGAERGQVFEHGPGARARPSPDLRTVVVDDGQGPMRLYDAATGKLRAALPASGEKWRSGASPWSPDGALLAHARVNSVYSTLWDLRDPDHPREVARLRPDGPADVPVGFTAFSADGQRIAVARIQTGTVTVFDTATGRRVSVLRAPTGIIIAPTFSPDGRTLAAVIVAGATGSVDFFDVATGHRRARLALRLPPASVVYGRNGTRIATITTRRLPTLSDPGTSSLMLWDTASLRPVGDELFFPGAVGPRIAPSPDGRRLVNSGDGSALMWDIDPSHWAAMACRIANRVLTRAEWERYVPHRAYHSGC